MMPDDSFDAELDSLAVDFLIVADYAEAVGGELYMMGGGWQQLGVREFPHQRMVAIAIGVSVPWSQTNQRHSLVTTIIDDDAPSAALVKIEGAFEAGRPVGLRAGASQRSVAAFNVPLRVERPGRLTVAVDLDGQRAKSTGFDVVAVT